MEEPPHPSVSVRRAVTRNPPDAEAPGIQRALSWVTLPTTEVIFAVEARSGRRVERGGAAGDGVYFEVEDDGGRGGTACVLRTIDDLQ